MNIRTVLLGTMSAWLVLFIAVGTGHCGEWDGLTLKNHFGSKSKITVQFEDKDGNLVEKKYSYDQLYKKAKEPGMGDICSYITEAYAGE